MEKLMTYGRDVLDSVDWAAYFWWNDGHLMDLDFEGARELTVAESKLVFPSIKMFQVGEGSDGRSLMAAAGEYSVESGDAGYLEAMRWFIKEENRHSLTLKRYMDVHGVSPAKGVPLDNMFRRLRRGGGLKREVEVLVTAEMIALCYYDALGRSVDDPLLSRICDQMLHDELRHVVFQSGTLYKLGQTAADERRRRLLMNATCVLVWAACKGVLTAGGYSKQRFTDECAGYLEQSIGISSTGHAPEGGTV